MLKTITPSSRQETSPSTSVARTVDKYTKNSPHECWNWNAPYHPLRIRWIWHACCIEGSRREISYRVLLSYRGNKCRFPGMSALRVLYQGKLSRNCVGSSSFNIPETGVNAQICSRYASYIEEWLQSGAISILNKEGGYPTPTQGRYPLNRKFWKPTTKHRGVSFDTPTQKILLKSKFLKSDNRTHEENNPPLLAKENIAIVWKF